MSNFKWQRFSLSEFTNMVFSYWLKILERNSLCSCQRVACDLVIDGSTNCSVHWVAFSLAFFILMGSVLLFSCLLFSAVQVFFHSIRSEVFFLLLESLFCLFNLIIKLVCLPFSICSFSVLPFTSPIVL